MTRCSRSVVWIVAITTLFAGRALAEDPATQPATHHRVLIISVDGLRPDAMLRARTPVLQNLMDHGSYTMWAQTTAVAVTLPSHVSMLTGVKPQKHEIEWNHDLPLATAVYPKVPTIFEFAKRAGYSTGMVAGKDKFDTLAKPGTIDRLWLPKEEYVPDDVVCAETLRVIDEGAPDVLFVHLPTVDHVGHAEGWGSIAQRDAIAHADQVIGQIVAAINRVHHDDPLLIIISADHGGAGKTHGADDVRSRNIPWIAVGPDVKQNFDLTTYADLTVRTEDTFATACDWLNIPLPSNLDGKPVKLMYEMKNAELLLPTTQPVAGR
jgi:predicted AlkP superfamily pyrophosphatase or phosphodiesterase